MVESEVAVKFSDYHEKWMEKLEDLLKLLIGVLREEHPQDNDFGYEAVVNKLTAHYKEYFTVKWAAAREDVLAFFSPFWLSPLENAYLWITGWKPSIAFRLVETLRKTHSPPGGSLIEMTEEQVKKIESLKLKIKAEEERVEREMERQQVSIADRKMVELVKMQIQAKKNGGVGATAQVDKLVDVAVKGLLAGLEKVMKMADCARLKTLKGLLDVLTPMQCVDFLAAASMLHIQTRKWGKKRN